MHRIAKAFLYVLVLLIAVPIASFLAYDFLVFQPRSSDIQRLIQDAAPEERNPTPLVSRVIRPGITQHLSGQVSRLLLHELNVLPSPSSQSQWHLTGAIWWALVEIHLSDREQMTLFLSLSYMGNNIRGFAAASEAVFKTPLRSLSLEQAATLAAISKFSSSYPDNPGRLARVRDAVVERVQNGL